MYTFAVTHAPMDRESPGQWKKIRVYLFESRHLLRIRGEQGSTGKAISLRSSHVRAFQALQAMADLYHRHLEERPPGVEVREGSEGSYIDVGSHSTTRQQQYSVLPDRLGQVGLPVTPPS